MIGDVAWTPGGRLVYRSNAGGGADIWVMNADGSNQKHLTSDARVFRGLSVSPDGRYIFFASDRAGQFNIWRADADGSNLKQLTDGDGDYFPHPTPDGAWDFLDPEAEESRWRIGVVPIAGVPPLKRFDFPPTVVTAQRLVRWSPDGRSIAYANSPGGLSDIWAQPLDGGPPRRLTDLKADQIIAFDWSPDGRTHFFVRGVETSDVVLISNSK